MNLKAKKYLYDIKVSIETIYNFTNNIHNLAEYQSNKLIRRGVEREIEIIGEAINQLLKMNTTIQITNARKIINTRNWVIHGYDNVDDIIIWDIVKNHIPTLLKEVIHYLQMP